MLNYTNTNDLNDEIRREAQEGQTVLVTDYQPLANTHLQIRPPPHFHLLYRVAPHVFQLGYMSYRPCSAALDATHPPNTRPADLTLKIAEAGMNAPDDDDKVNEWSNTWKSPEEIDLVSGDVDQRRGQTTADLIGQGNAPGFSGSTDILSNLSSYNAYPQNPIA